MGVWEIDSGHVSAAGVVVTPERRTFTVPDEGVGQRSGGSGFIVIVYDNDFNTWAEVTGILMKATGCTPDEAEIETWEIHHLGKSVVHHGDRDECDRAAEIIRTIGIRVVVVED